MNVTLYCPNLRCRMVLEVPEKARGRRVRCSRCGTNFMVPAKAGDGKNAAVPANTAKAPAAKS